MKITILKNQYFSVIYFAVVGVPHQPLLIEKNVHGARFFARKTKKTNGKVKVKDTLNNVNP